MLPWTKRRFATNVAVMGSTSAPAFIDYHLTGGGASAGDPVAGGGNGGNTLKAAGVSAPAIGSYSVVAGAGGTSGGDGSSSTFNGLTATGGSGFGGSGGINSGSSTISGASLSYGNGGNNNLSGATGIARGYGGDTDAGDGGRGIVIIAYVTGTITATGGTITTSGGNTIHTFTSNGTWQRTA